MDDEHDRHPREERGEGPHEDRRKPVQRQRPGDERSGQEQAGSRRGETKPEPEPFRGQQAGDPERGRRRQPRKRERAPGETDLEIGGHGAHRRNSLDAWTSAGFRSSWAKTASTYGGHCGAGDSPGMSVIAQRRRRPFIETGSGRSPVRSS